MTPVKQTVFGVGGNCLAACVASLLDLPVAEVPNFGAMDDWKEVDGELVFAGEGSALGWWFGLRDFLLPRGLMPVQLVRREGGKLWGAGASPGALGIATIKSKRGNWLHCVIVDLLRGVVVWDPAVDSPDNGRHLYDGDIEDWIYFARRFTAECRHCGRDECAELCIAAIDPGVHFEEPA